MRDKEETEKIAQGGTSNGTTDSQRLERVKRGEVSRTELPKRRFVQSLHLGDDDDQSHQPREEIALRITGLDLDKDTKIRVYRRRGRRARVALAALEELGFTNAPNVGGIGDVRELQD